MKKRLAMLGLAMLLAACGGAPSGLGAASPSPTSAASASPTPSPAPSPAASANGAITLAAPAVNAVLTSPVTISGDASVFEAALQWRITDTAGRVIVEGNTTANLGAPGRGTYSVTATYAVTRETVAFVEVYSRSPKDGNIDELVRVPVTLR
jgi:hypothetical protein